MVFTNALVAGMVYSMLSQRINVEVTLLKNEIKEIRDVFERKLQSLEEHVLKLEDTKREVSNEDPDKETDRNLPVVLDRGEIWKPIKVMTKAFREEKMYVRSFEKQVNHTIMEFKNFFHGLLENVIQETKTNFKELSLNISDQTEQINNILDNKISNDLTLQRIAHQQIKFENQMADAKIVHQVLSARLESRKISFSASVMADQTTNIGEKIKFDGVTHSRGGGYNKLSGIFTCPITGIYLFSVTLVCDPKLGKTLLAASLKANSDVKMNMVSRSSGREDFGSAGSNLIILYLSKGTEVYVETYSGEATVMKYLSTFRGALLYN